MHHIGRVNGLFLSSGIVKNGSFSQDRLIDTAYLLRHKHNYRGYLHLKILPGVEREQLKQAMVLADRISINLEAPNIKRLKMLAPEKDYTHELLTPLQWAQEIRSNQFPQIAWRNNWPSTVTQFVVGASGEKDIELLTTSEKLMSKMGLSRIYFSGFTPITDTPLEDITPTPLLRQNRLYQASYLMRDYGFSMEELPFMKSGNLPLDVDPKMAWAAINLKNQLVEINTASKHLLLRIPGIGPIGADAILLNRKTKKIVDLSTLHKLGIQTTKAAPYILINGKRPPFQTRLFNLLY
jgi:predicted DNA-binding helix-hairpin-helix protein